MNSKVTETRPELDAKAAVRLQRARAAAKRFCREFGFSEAQIEQLEDPPIQAPLVIELHGRRVEVYRWLGHGRGQSYVQVEIEIVEGALLVHGSLADREFGPWRPPN